MVVVFIILDRTFVLMNTTVGTVGTSQGGN